MENHFTSKEQIEKQIKEIEARINELEAKKKLFEKEKELKEKEMELQKIISETHPSSIEKFYEVVGGKIKEKLKKKAPEIAETIICLLP